MASLDNIPGLAGFLQQQQINQQRGAQELQNAGGAAQLIGALQTQGIQRRQQQIVDALLPGLLAKAGIGMPGAQGSPQDAGSGAGGGSGSSPVVPALPGSDMAMLGALLKGDVGGGLQNIGKMQFEAGKGIAQRPGAPVVNPFTGAEIAPAVPAVAPGAGAVVRDPTNPSGFRVEPVPGQVPAAAALTGAQTAARVGAEAPYQFEQVEQPGGGHVPVSRASLAGGIQAKVYNAPDDATARTLAQSLQAAGEKNFQVRVAGREPSPPQPSPSAPQPSGDPWAAVPKRPLPSGTGGQTTFDKKMAEESAVSSQKLSEKYGSQADAANTRLALNQQALGLVDQSDTGPLAARQAGIKNWLTKFVPGIKESDFENTPSATIALQKDLVNAATQKAKQQFGARITQSEVMLMLTRGAPNVDMTKAAIKYLIGTDIAQSIYQIQQANDLGRYLQSGGDPMRFEGWYAFHFPASSAINQVHLGTTTGGAIRGGAAPNSAPTPAASGGIRFLGFEPQ